MNLKDKAKSFLCIVCVLVVISGGMICVENEVAKCVNIGEEGALMAAFSVMPNGYVEEEKKIEKTVKKPKREVVETTDEKEVKEKSENKNEAKYRINEMDMSGGGVDYGIFSIKNTTSYDIDAQSLLSAKLPFKMKDSHEVQVLIVHTHACESYMEDDNGYYYESFYPRSTDINKNVVAVGKAISKSLKSKGIGVVNATTLHDSPSYDGAYSRSFDTISKYLDRYKEIKVVLDIHRDSMTQDDNTKLKPTFTYNGKKGAQIMIMSGHDESYTDFPHWEENLNFALKLQKTCEQMYPSMTRPMYFGDFTYNMNANNGSLLIEVGTDANTLNEAVYSGELLGNALAKVLQNQ